MSAQILPLPGGPVGAPITVAAPSPAVPGAALVSRFETALRAPSNDDALAAAAVPGASAAGASGTDIARMTPLSGATHVAGMASDVGAQAGERILATLHAVSAGAGDAWGRMTQFATVAGEPSMAHLLQIQMRAMQASVQFDYVGKIISRSTQNIDQLIKTQ